MEIRNKLYPYPVLAYFLKDYKDTSKFEVKPSLTVDGYRQIVTFDIDLENADLQQMLKSSEAEIILHLECNQTGYRHILLVPEGEKSISFVIPDEQVAGKIQVCSFIVAAKDISSYMNSDFDDDFKGMSFSIEKGNVLAVAKQMDIRVKKRTDDLRNLPSILNVMLNAEPKAQYMQIDLGGSLIDVLLPAHEWQQFGSLNDSGRLNGVFASIIAVPALIYTIEYLQRIKAPGRIELSEKNKIWYDCLKRALLENFHLDLEDKKFDNQNSFELAQKLIGGPLDDALKELIRSKD